MSFDLICSGCGALSGPSVGICPYCKTVMTSFETKNFKQLNSINQLYENGRIELALDLAKKMYESDIDSKNDIKFLMLYSKILIDSEGPSSLIKAILSEAHLLDPRNQDVLDYIDLIEAKSNLKSGYSEIGETILRNLIRRSPNNVHAHFLLGTHHYWTDQKYEVAIQYLETCVRLSPNFLRAWGCLGAIYKKLDIPQLSMRAFQRCTDLETEPKMKEFFKRQINSAK